jgi:quercetin dioxygenase-like cupin family protein
VVITANSAYGAHILNGLARRNAKTLFEVTKCNGDQRMSTTDEGRFCISRAADAKFTNDPFRDWLTSRDFGLDEATNGAFGGQITRARELGHTTGPHRHNMTFQMVYVLKGWVKFWYEGEGEFVFKEGDFVYHPPRALHDLRDYSADVELLEIFAPARPGTEEQDSAVSPN